MTTPISNMTDTWNDGGTVFKSIKMVITDTAHAAGSKIIDLTTVVAGGYFNVDELGNMAISAQLDLSGGGFGNTKGVKIGANTFIYESAEDKFVIEVGGVAGIRIIKDTWGASNHFDELSDTPTAIADMWSLYSKTNNLLYFQDGAGVEHVAHGFPTFKSYTYHARDASTGVNFSAGFYDADTADANLTQASLTATHGSANHPYGAHAFIVSGGDGTTDGSDLVVTVSGTSVDDSGNRTPADSEVIEATAGTSPLNSYYETIKKWVGTITFTLSSTGGATFSYDFNYGLAKYEDFGNMNYTLIEFESVGLANANDSSFNVEILHHSTTGWTFAATGFVPGNTVIAAMNTDYSTEQDLAAGEPFAYKRSDLSTSVAGDNGEGIIIRVTTGVNNSISYMDSHIGVSF